MQIRQLLRAMPTLPLKADGSNMSVEDVATGVRLPLYSCPFFGCNAHFSDRTRFLHHVAGGFQTRRIEKRLRKFVVTSIHF